MITCKFIHSNFKWLVYYNIHIRNLQKQSKGNNSYNNIKIDNWSPQSLIYWPGKFTFTNNASFMIKNCLIPLLNLGINEQTLSLTFKKNYNHRTTIWRVKQFQTIKNGYMTCTSPLIHGAWTIIKSINCVCKKITNFHKTIYRYISYEHYFLFVFHYIKTMSCIGNFKTNQQFQFHIPMFSTNTRKLNIYNAWIYLC